MATYCEIEDALNIPDIKQRYEYAYDLICDHLDKQFRENNYCDFSGDSCTANRRPKSKNRIMGCCYSFNHDFFMNVRNKKICKHFDTDQKKCTTKCLPCKLYTCEHLRKKGIAFYIYGFPKIEKVFTKNQIEVLKNNCFRSKEEIIDKLLKVKNSKLPNFLFILFSRAQINNNRNRTCH